MESGLRGLEVCLQMGISEQTWYNWKRKYSGMGTIELRRLKELEDENKKLKQLVKVAAQPDLERCLPSVLCEYAQLHSSVQRAPHYHLSPGY